MAKIPITTSKMIAGIIIAILVASSILFIISTMLTSDPQRPETSQGETGNTEATRPSGETGAAASADEEEVAGGINSSFSIAWITDTQLNSQDATWGNLADYLVSVKDAYNIQAVVHTGDIVQNGSAAKEWEVANASIGVLLDNNVPYLWNTGNHDWDHNLIGEYEAFQPAQQESESYWLSSHGNCSTAVQFSYSGHDFIIIALEMFADSSTMAWFTNILGNNTDKNILVATHSYLNATGGYGDQWGETWGNNLRAILDTYPNVFATINGHWTTSYRQTVGNRTEMLADYMNTDFTVVTYLFFDLLNERVYVKTYRQTDATWYTANAQNFSFDVDLR